MLKVKIGWKFELWWIFENKQKNAKKWPIFKIQTAARKRIFRIGTWNSGKVLRYDSTLTKKIGGKIGDPPARTFVKNYYSDPYIYIYICIWAIPREIYKNFPDIFFSNLTFGIGFKCQKMKFLCIFDPDRCITIVCAAIEDLSSFLKKMNFPRFL